MSARLHAGHNFRERAAILDYTVRGALSPPQTSRAPSFATQEHARMRDSNARFECCARQHPGHGGHFGKPIKEGVPGLQRGPKAKPPRLTYSIFRSYCHLPAMNSTDRRLRPVSSRFYQIGRFLPTDEQSRLEKVWIV